MKITLVRSLARSAMFELSNDTCYRAPAPYTVLLDGAEVLQGDTNVFSLFSLEPDHAYELAVTIGDEPDPRPYTTARQRK